MHLSRYYRKETDLELIKAAMAAYLEAPPTITGQSTGFARSIVRAGLSPDPEVPRADCD